VTRSVLLEANDTVLAPLIGAADEPARAGAVEALAGRAGPLMDAILRRYASSLSSDEIGDLRATAMMRLVRRLNDVPHAGPAAITRFDDFVATLTFNVANDLLRERFPARTRLKNRIRYALTHGRRVASWRAAAGIVAGFVEWRGGDPIGYAGAVALPAGDLERASARCSTRRALRCSSTMSSMP